MEMERNYCFAEYGKDLLALDVDFETFPTSKRTVLKFSPLRGLEPEIEIILELDDLNKLQEMINDALAYHDDNSSLPTDYI